MRVFAACLLGAVVSCSAPSEPPQQPAVPPLPSDAGTIDAALVADAAAPDAAAPDAASPDAAPSASIDTGLVTAADAAPTTPAPTVTTENRCTANNECVLDDVDCSICGSCPGAREAVNRRTYRQQVRECRHIERRRRASERQRRKRRARKRPRPKCGACKDGDPKGWPTHAVCDRGACVPAGSWSSVLDPAPVPLKGATVKPRLSRSDVVPGLRRSQERALRCRSAKDPFQGSARVTLRIRKTGEVHSAKVNAPAGARMRRCIEKAFRLETYPASLHGLRLVYPIEFRKPG